MSLFGNNKPAIFDTTAKNISNASYSNGVITVNTTTPHNLVAGDDILIQNVANMTDLNGIRTVNSILDNYSFTINSTSNYTTGSGGTLNLGVWFKWAKISYNFNEADLIEHRSIITGQRNFLYKGEYANCTVDYYIYKLNNDELAKRKLLLLYSWYGKIIYFLPYGTLGIKRSDYAMNICLLKELKLMKLNGIVNYDIVRINIVTTEYHDITKLIL